MTQTIPAPADTLVTLHGDHPTTSSLIIARHFGKSHKDVLRAIDNLECSTEFWRRNFELSDYVDQRGKRQPMYNVTRDGFMLAGMGFNGAQAVRMKEGFITAFNGMETALRQRAEADIHRLAAVIAPELLRADPRRRQLVRYRKMGLTMPEIRLLTGRGEKGLRSEYRLLEACGLLQVDPQRQRRRDVARNNLALVGVAA